MQTASPVPPPAPPPAPDYSHNNNIATTYISNPFILGFNALDRLFKTNSGWAITIIIGTVLSFIAQVVLSFIDALQADVTTTSSIETSLNSGTSEQLSAMSAIAILGIVVIVAIAAIITAALIQVLLTGMFTYVMNQSEQGEKVSVSEAFNATKARFGRLLLATLLANIKIAAWSLLLIVPGIIAALRFSLLPYLIMNESPEERGVFVAHDKVKSLTKGRLLEVFGVGTVAAIIPIVGGLLGIAGRGALYRQLHLTRHAPNTRPGVHWLNYTGLVIAGILFAIFILLMIGLIFSLYIAWSGV